jgi:hypothetical protein
MGNIEKDKLYFEESEMVTASRIMHSSINPFSAKASHLELSYPIYDDETALQKVSIHSFIIIYIE